MEFRVLGTLAVVRAGETLRIGGPKRRLLLAALLSEANRPVSDDMLLRAMHGDDSWDGDRKAVHVLRVQVDHLRRALRGQDGGSVQPLKRDGSAYVLEVRADELDELIFLRLMEQARRLRQSGRVDASVTRVDEALAVWRGEPLSDLDERPFVRRYVERLRELRLDAEKERSAAYLAAGRSGPLVPELRRLTAAYPGDERLRTDLALALYREGRPQEAAAACRDGLIQLRERGMDSAALLERQRAILNDDPVLRWEPPPGRVELSDALPRRIRSQLPADTGHFTARDDETARLMRHLSAGESSGAVAVATIAGKAGVGKTALAVHVGHLLRSRFPDGVLYVDLQPPPGRRADPANVLVGLLLELGIPRDRIPEEPDARAALYRSTLDGSRTLVVLDNATDEEQVRPLLPGTASCAVLVTSRPQLSGLDGDHLLLDVMDPHGAVSLLAKVARQARVGEQPDEARAIVELCGHLPLAVRIAGARLAQRPTERLLWLRDQLEDERTRLNVLRAGDLEVRASVDLSYRALPERARRALRLLAVPDVGDVSELAAAALLDTDIRAAVDLLDSLVDAQLMERTSQNNGESRYRFHDLLRLFARERLTAEAADDHPAALGRLLEMYLTCAEDATDRLHQGNAPVVPRRSESRWILADRTAQDRSVAEPTRWFDTERGNLVALVEQAAATGFDEMTWLLCAALVDFFELGAHWTDWRQTHETALAAARRAGNRLGEANMLRHLGVLRRLRGDLGRARGLLEDSLRVFEDEGFRQGEAAARRNLGELSVDEGHTMRAISDLLRSRDLCRQENLDFGYARTLQTLGRAYLANGRLARALSCLEAAVASFDMAGNRPDAERSRMDVAHALLRTGRVDDASRLLNRAERYFREGGYAPLRAEVLLLLGDAHAGRSRDVDAFDCYDSCLVVFQERRDALNQARTLAHRGRLHAWRDELRQARASWQQALALFPNRAGADEVAEEAEVRGWLDGHSPGTRPGQGTDRVLDHFDDADVVRRVRESEYLVRVMSTWTELSEIGLLDRFLDAVSVALSNGAVVQILLIDPEPTGSTRHGTHSGRGGRGPSSALSAPVQENLAHLAGFTSGLPAASRRHLTVRLSSAAPNVAYYRWDDRALVVSLLVGDSPVRAPQYEVPVDSIFAQFVEEQFNRVWTQDSRLIDQA